MALFERPARHRPALRDSGEAGGRYLTNSVFIGTLGLVVVKYVGFTPLKPWESLPGSSRPKYLATSLKPYR